MMEDIVVIKKIVNNAIPVNEPLLTLIVKISIKFFYFFVTCFPLMYDENNTILLSESFIKITVKISANFKFLVSHFPTHGY